MARVSRFVSGALMLGQCRNRLHNGYSYSCSPSHRVSQCSFAPENPLCCRGRVGSRNPVEFPIRSRALQRGKRSDDRAVALEQFGQQLTLRRSTQSVSHYKLPARLTQHRVTAENRSAKNALTVLDAIPLAAWHGQESGKPCLRNVWTGLTQKNRARRWTSMTPILTS